MIASTQITKTEIFSFMIVIVFELLSRNVLFTNRKYNINCQNVDCFLRKYQISRVNYHNIINRYNTKFSGYF